MVVLRGETYAQSADPRTWMCTTITVPVGILLWRRNKYDTCYTPLPLIAVIAWAPTVLIGADTSYATRPFCVQVSSAIWMRTLEDRLQTVCLSIELRHQRWAGLNPPENKRCDLLETHAIVTITVSTLVAVVYK